MATERREQIFDRRKQFLVEFLPLVKQRYNEIAKPSARNDNLTEYVSLFYNSDLLQTSFLEILATCQAKDIMAMRTTNGIHRDDLEFNLNEQPFKNIASQGQRKSLLFALKLAEMEVLNKEKGFAPLLLLDDVFEKLDEERIVNLLQTVCVENDGQVFITDTSSERLVQHLTPLKKPFQLIDLTN